MRAPYDVTTRRLHGRRVRHDDLSYIVEVDSDFRIQRTLFGAVQTEDQSRDRLQRWVQMWDESGFGFWLFSEGDGPTIGHGGLFKSPREAGEVEVGYVLRPEQWGRGLATEIAQAALHVGFEHMLLERIIAIAQAPNAASRRVMENCGLTFETEIPSPDGIPGVRYAIARSAHRRPFSACDAGASFCGYLGHSHF
jgi:ribosomal-protein-alanine N-acetyltransferase